MSERIDELVADLDDNARAEALLALEILRRALVEPGSSRIAAAIKAIAAEIPTDALGRLAAWHIEDSRTPGKRAGIASYPSFLSAAATIEAWRQRDARGGRPDIHELMPYLVAIEGP
jgi:hypothetical protein